MPKLETLVSGLGFIEGLRQREGRIWFSDFSSRQVCSMGADKTVRVDAYVPGQPSGLGFDEMHGGALLVVSVHDSRILRVDASGPIVVADIGARYRGGLNDMLTTADGRCYVSTFPPPLIGRPSPDVPADGGSMPLFLVEPSGDFHVVADGLKFPNGMALTPDGAELIVAETIAARLSIFSVRRDGRLGERRTLAELGNRMPDGICADSQGRIWVASPFTSEFVRVEQSGNVREVIAVPGRWAVTCALGVTDDELYCATAVTTIDDYKMGRAVGAIERWSAD